MSDPTRIGVAGASGRMGTMLIREIVRHNGCVLSGASARGGSAVVGADAGRVVGLDALNVTITDRADEMFAAADVVVDFTTPAATVAHAALARRHGVALVVGTTGLDRGQAAALEAAAHEIALVHAPNMSLGVTLLTALVERVARALDTDYDIEILEMHHRRKLDAPSGTALNLGHAAAKGRGIILDEVAARGTARDGRTGVRRVGDIGFGVLRGGDVVGEHTVVFAGAAERLELTHRAHGREVFARGAVQAALWAAGRRPGLYDMTDVLGLKD